MKKSDQFEVVGRAAKFTYYGGTFASADTLAFMLGRDELLEKEVANTIVYSWNGQELTKEGYTITGIAICAGTIPIKEVVLVARTGDIRAGKLGSLQADAKIKIDSNDGKYGYLANARTIAGRIHVCGMDRQVYRRIKKGWERFDDGLPMSESEDVAGGLRAIDGFNADEIYAVGTDGEIWQCDRGKWRSCTSPTNLILHGVHCADDGLVYACGQLGVVLKGRGDDWSVIDHGLKLEDLWDIVRFRGAAYVMSSRVLYRLESDELVPVDYGDTSIPFSFYRFACNGEQLVTIGGKDVMLFDGDRWRRIDG